MSETKIVVPEDMLKAAWEENRWRSHEDEYGVRCALEAALGWLSENPIVPSDEQIGRMVIAKRQFDGYFDPTDWIRWGATDWQRRMFLAPEPEMIGEETLNEFCSRHQRIGDAVLEAYHRGQKSKEKP